jgi:hypothetical protein
LKVAQVLQKRVRRRVEVGRRRQVSRRGTHGRRNRGSWCGMIESMRIEVVAEERRGLRKTEAIVRWLKG